MIKEVLASLLIVFSVLMNTNAIDYKYVEIFDIGRGEVVNVANSNSKIENTAISYLRKITGVYSKFDPIPKRGHAVRICFETPVSIQNKYLNAVVDEVIIMFPDDNDSPPFLMVFDNDDRLMCFTFKGNTNILSKALNFKPIIRE